MLKYVKTQTNKNNLEKREKYYKCDICKTILPTFREYHKHVSDNSDCKQRLPYSCQFCPYIGYEPYGFQKHLQCKPTCDQFYKEKK